MLEEAWPDSNSGTASQDNAIGNASIETRIKEEPLIPKRRIRTPEYTGNKLLQTGDLEEHILKISRELTEYPDLTPVQRAKYAYNSLGYQLASLFTNQPTMTEIVDTLIPVVLEKLPEPVVPKPWYFDFN